MFNTSFDHRYVNRQKVGGLTTHLYHFKISARQEILVEVQELEKHPLAIVKFCDKADRNSKHRFNKLTRKGNFKPILRTCINIMLEIYEHNPYMSFCFAGAQTELEQKIKKKGNTQRFKLYRYAMNQFFSTARFQHQVLEDCSIYFMFNRHYCETKPEVQNDMIACINEEFPGEIPL